MIRTYLYVPEELDREIKATAKLQNKSKAEVIRQALDAGLDNIKKENAGGVQALLDLAKTAKKLGVRGPRDLSVNHDYYLWGGKKKNLKIKP